MEENVILDCIVVANAISNSTHDDKTTSESDRNDHDGQTDDVPAQDTNLDDRNKPGGMRAQALIIKSRFNLSPSGRKSLNVISPRIRAQTAYDMRTKRPRSSDAGEERPQKRANHKPREEAGDLRGFQTNTRHRPAMRIAFMGRGKLKAEQVKPVPRRHDTAQAHSKAATFSRQGTDEKVVEIVSDLVEGSSSDAPLAIRRREKKKINTQAKSHTTIPGDDSDDKPIFPTVRRRLFTRATLDSGSGPETACPQPQKNETRQPVTSSRLLENQLTEIKQELDMYRKALKKERAKSRGLEKQRLLWEAKKLMSQDINETMAQTQVLLKVHQPRTSPSNTVQREGQPEESLQVTRGEYQRVLDLNKQLERQLWDAELARLKVTKSPKDYDMKQMVHDTEEPMDVNSQAGALVSVLQEKVADIERQLQQERELGRQRVENSNRLGSQVADWTQKVKQREAALQEETVKCQSLESEVVKQRQQISEETTRMTELVDQILHLKTSKSELHKTIDQLDWKLQLAKQHIEFVWDLQSSADTRTQELNAQLKERQTVIEKIKEEVEEMREGRDWYKTEVDRLRKRYREDTEARDREELVRLKKIWEAFESQ